MILRELREAAGLSQYMLAKRSGVTQGQIWRIETEGQGATSDTINRLCDALGCTADELLGREPPREAS